MTDEADALDPKLRIHSDTFLRQLEDLLDLEQRKRVMAVDDPAFVQLARDVQDGARALLDRADKQRVAAQEAHDGAVDAGVSAAIVDIPADLHPAQILKSWRDVDRELSTTEPGTPRHAELEATADMLRRAYLAAYERERGS